MQQDKVRQMNLLFWQIVHWQYWIYNMLILSTIHLQCKWTILLQEQVVMKIMLWLVLNVNQDIKIYILLILLVKILYHIARKSNNVITIQTKLGLMLVVNVIVVILMLMNQKLLCGINVSNIQVLIHCMLIV